MIVVRPVAACESKYPWSCSSAPRIAIARVTAGRAAPDIQT